MARGTRSLWIALIAAVLLVAVVSVDAAVNRTVSLDVQDQDGQWRTIATSLETDAFYPRPGGEIVVEANRTDELDFRLTVDNEPPWGFAEDYSVRGNGRIVASGSITADGGGTGEARFSVPADDLLQERAPKGLPRTSFASVEVQLGDTFLYGSFQIDEIPQEGGR